MGDIYRDTLPLLNFRTVELLDLPRLAALLCGLERRPTRGAASRSTTGLARTMTSPLRRVRRGDPRRSRRARGPAS
jgi:hypothetical protein